MNLLRSLRDFRARAASRLMERSLGTPPDRYAVFWQPAWIPFLRLACLTGAGALVALLHPTAVEITWAGWSFFRFEEVFRFQLPGREIFDIALRGALAALFVLYAGPAILRQVASLRSYLLIRKSDGALHLVEGGILRRRVTVLLPIDIAGSALHENVFLRWINTADLIIDTKAGKEITLRAIGRARDAFQMIENARAGD